jgi:hypothetical protein
VQRRRAGVHQPVGPLGLYLRRRAQRAHVRRQLQGGAVGRGGQPAALALRAGQPEVPGGHVGEAAVTQDRYREGGDQGGRVARDLAPSAAGRQQEDHRGQDQDHSHGLERRRGAEDQARRDREPDRDRGPPEQHGQPRHDQRVEPDIRHDHLFHLQLIGVQQDRGDGHGRQPPGGAAAQQHDVQDDGHRQARQALQDDDDRQAAERQDDLQQQPVPERVGAGVDAVQVFEGVNVDQRGVVRDLGQDPQHQTGGQEHRHQPVTAQQHERPGGP